MQGCGNVQDNKQFCDQWIEVTSRLAGGASDVDAQAEVDALRAAARDTGDDRLQKHLNDWVDGGKLVASTAARDGQPSNASLEQFRSGSAGLSKACDRS